MKLEREIPFNKFGAYDFLKSAHEKYLARVRESGNVTSDDMDTLRILQSAMTSVMVGAEGIIY